MEGLGATLRRSDADMWRTFPESSGARATTKLLLDGRALNRTERAKDAAMAWVGPKNSMTAGALVEIETGIGWHGLRRRVAALRTGEDRLEDRQRVHGVGPNVRHER